MTEASGSCATLIKTHAGIVSPNFAPKAPQTSVLDNLKETYKAYKANKDVQEYERILNKPAEERTFAEKCFVAQMRMAITAGKIEEHLPKPKVEYVA